MASLNPSTAANWLANKWRPNFERLPNEEEVVTADFMDATGGVARGINNTLYLRKVGVASATALATTDATVTMQDIADYAVSLAPTFHCSAVEPNLQLLARLESESALMSALKQQLVASLATAGDALGAQQVASFSSDSQAGNSGVAALDQSLFLDGWGKLVVNAKDAFKVGVTKATLIVYNKQAKNIVNIPGFTYSNIRGDGVGPIVRGWVNEAMNTTIKESGNVYTNSGTAHNLLHLPMAIAKAYNLKPTLLDPQPYQNVIRLLAVQDIGHALFFDQFGVDIMTSDS